MSAGAGPLRSRKKASFFLPPFFALVYAVPNSLTCPPHVLVRKSDSEEEEKEEEEEEEEEERDLINDVRREYDYTHTHTHMHTYILTHS